MRRQMNPNLLEMKIEGRTEEEMLERLGRGSQEKKTRRVADYPHPPAQRRRRFRQQSRPRSDLDKFSAEQSDHGSCYRHQSHGQISKALEQLLKRYDPAQFSRSRETNQGEYTGRIGAGVSLIFYEEIIPKPKPEDLAPIYLKELEMWGAAGVTTWSSSLGSEAISAFHYMDQKGMMPIRLAYTNEAGYRDNIYGESFVNRFGNLIGHGTERFWLVGISSGSTDSSYPGVCTTPFT